MRRLLLWWPWAAFAGPTLAIADLDNHTGDPSLDAAGPGVAAVLTTKLARVDGITVVERARLQAVLDELALAGSGAVDPATAARAGQLLGADHVVLGALFSVQLPALSVSLRVVDSSTGEIVAAEEVRGEIGAGGEELFVLLDELSVRILGSLDVSLAARDRIRLSQVDVEGLRTVQVYGEALRALDRGDAAAAESLLGQAAALEPGFTLAEQTLRELAAALSSRRATVAHAAITEGDARLRALQEAVDPLVAAIPAEAAPSAEQLAALALRAQLHLVRGEFPAYFSAEERRLALIERWHPPGEEGRRAQSAFDTARRDLLQAQQSAWLRSDVFHQVHYWPHEIRRQMAEILARLGRVDEAMALIVAAYQRPGPTGSANEQPWRPATFADHWDGWDLAVVLARQELRLAELRGHGGDAIRATRALETAVREATEARERRRQADEIAAALGAGPIDLALLRRERELVRLAGRDQALKLPGYHAFLRRFEAGAYAGVLGTRELREVASGWHDIARDVWNDQWFFEQRLAALLAFQQQVPPADEAEAERYRARVAELAEGGWR